MRLQEAVRGRKFVRVRATRNGCGTIVRVVLLIRNDERVVRQLIVRQILRVLAQPDDIISLRLAPQHVGEVREWIVAFHVRIRIPARPSGRRYALRIRFPRLAGSVELANYIVGTDSATEVAVVRYVLSGRQPKIITD